MGKLSSFANYVKLKASSFAAKLGLMPVPSYPVVIDISYCQAVNSINWVRLKELGVAVIIRMGQSVWEDNLFRAHYANAVKYGVPFGIYWFYQPDQPPTLQIAAFLKIYSSLSCKPPIFLDVENISYWESLIVDGKPVLQDGLPMQILINILPPNPTTHSAWLKTWLTEVEKVTGIIPGIYTRADYWNQWTLRSPDWAHFYLWIASWTNYSFEIRMPLDWDKWTVWQWIGGQNRQDGVIGPVDGNYFNGTETASNNFFTGAQLPEEKTMPGTYNTNVPHLDRARLVALSADDKNIDVTGVCAGADAVILKMAGQDGPSVPDHKEVYADGAFPIYADRATKPTLGWITLSANFQLWIRSMMLDPFKARKWFQNETLRVILQTWLKVPFKDYEWKEGLVLKADPALWHPLNGLILYMDRITTNPGGEIAGMWQLAVLDDILKNLKAFMDGGFVPNVPVYFAAPASFYQKYDQDPSWLNLVNRLQNGSLAGVGVVETGMFTEVPMATPFATVAEIFAYRPADSFKYTAAPYGFDVQFHIYSFNRFMAASAFYPGALVTPLMAAEWCDTVAAMNKALTVVIPPPVVPPPELPPVVPSVSIDIKLDNILALLQEIFAWLKSKLI